MITKPRIVKRAGRWCTKASDGVQFHPSWHLAMLHAGHITHEDRFTRPMGEHLTTRVNDLRAWLWTADAIATAADVPVALVRDISSGDTRRVTPAQSEAITTIYRKACAA